MKTILIASILALFDDPTTTTTAPSCEELLAEAEEDALVCEEQLDNANHLLEAAIAWAEGTSGGGAAPCEICDVVAACRRAGTSDLAGCVNTGCAEQPGNCY